MSIYCFEDKLVLDADIKGFFDNLDHEWIMEFIESKIKNPNLTRLIWRMLKVGIMKDFHFEVSETGSGQGSVCSPVIANIYMAHVKRVDYLEPMD